LNEVKQSPFFVALAALILSCLGCDFKIPNEKKVVGVWVISSSAKEKPSHFMTKLLVGSSSAEKAGGHALVVFLPKIVATT